MSLQLNTPPAIEPVSLDQAKAWLRVESGGDEDALIAALIPAARARAEWHTGRAFVTQHWTLWLDSVGDGCIALPLPPLVGVESVTLYAADDTATVLDPD
ncbi:MAG TPA: head-tail connector protein, partial [Rhizomicrobium sp.]